MHKIGIMGTDCTEHGITTLSLLIEGNETFLRMTYPAEEERC